MSCSIFLWWLALFFIHSAQLDSQVSHLPTNEMYMLKVISITLVLTGLVSIVAALRPAYLTYQAERGRGWSALLMLMVAFVLGYLSVLYVAFSTPGSLLGLGVAAILCGGGIFVIVVIQLSFKSICRAIKESERQFYEARHDALTSLPNRMHFMEYINDLLCVENSKKKNFAVLILDLDRFKEINDTLGHSVGDELLAELGRRIKNLSTPNNIVSRLGGDEFALILPVTDEAEAIASAEELADTVEQPFSIEDYVLAVDSSIGIALHPRDGVDKGSLMKHADVAMYLAKAKKQRYMVYDESKDYLSEKRLKLLARVKEALLAEEFELHYQPVFASADLSVHGFEALIRWRQPDGSFILPGEFIPQIEQTRFIGSLSRWVIKNAVKKLSLLSDFGLDLRMNINLSAVDLQDASLAAYINDCVEEYAISPESLCFEVTETAIMFDLSRAIDVAAAIRSLGAKVALDDFGTGFSSLSLLQEFPAYVIKIDRSFVATMAVNAEDRSIVKSMVKLGHNLDRYVVAEGVEDINSLDALRQFECDFIQGYILSKPMNCSQTTSWLENYLLQPKQEIGAANNFA